MPPIKRLALTIAGAVSLGSYEAGAMFEILDAIRQHNQAVSGGADGSIIHVDVITGASAGGMTGTILAQKLLFNGPAFNGPYDNPLFNTWVKQIDLAGLDDTAQDPATLSVFSSNRIETIAADTLTADLTPDGKSIADHGPHAAIDPAKGIRLGLALTNLNGLNYGVPLKPSGTFQYTNFSDQLLRTVTSTSRDLSIWQELREAAVACGAFPVAFRTKDLLRSQADYSNETWPVPTPTATFTYSDGGILQNQPLGMAKNFVDTIDGHQDDDSRFYLFVSPNPMKGSQDLKLSQATANIVRVLERLVPVYTGQAVFRDWLQTGVINSRVRQLDKYASELVTALSLNPGEPGAVHAATLTAASAQLRPLLYGYPNGPADDLADQARLRQQYELELQQLGGPETPNAIAFLGAIQTLEKAAGLGAREIMNVYGVVIEPGKLAGSGIFAFEGFFDEAYRYHDYEWGRRKAQDLISAINREASPTLGPIHYQPQPTQIVPAFDGLKLDAIDPQDRDRFTSAIQNRVNQMLKVAIPNVILRIPAQLAAGLILKAFFAWEFHRHEQA